MDPSTRSDTYDINSLPDACWKWPPNLAARRKIRCGNCGHFHPPELCRGPLDSRGRLPLCTFCGSQSHLIDFCHWLKKDPNRQKWLKYLAWDSRKGLAPLRTMQDFSSEVDDSSIVKPVLNPAIAKFWERMVISLDRAANRDKYWNRFQWNKTFTVLPSKILHLLPTDISVPEALVGKGPPSWLPKSGTMPTHGYTQINAGIVAHYSSNWALFENAARQPPDTEKTMKYAQTLFDKSVSESEHAHSLKRGREEINQTMRDAPDPSGGPTKKPRTNPSRIS